MKKVIMFSLIFNITILSFISLSYADVYNITHYNDLPKKEDIGK